MATTLRCILASLLLSPRVCLARDFAVARPFATPAEVSGLQSSLEAWSSLLPCSGATTQPVDLFLVFSRTLSEDALATAATEAIVRDFANKSQAWHSCFRAVKVLSANLTAEEDVYEPTAQETNRNWVKGPNSVFRFLLRHFLASSYESFFFMELDSWPQRANWLEQFLREASTPGVAIRGSRYRGDKWDSFLPQIPDALRAHINGNAIYNVRHPFMAWLSERLNEDAKGGDDVAFDVRMAELTLQARGTRIWSDLVPAGTDPYLSDSKLVGNYANTLLNASFDGGEFVTHVAKSNFFSELGDARVTLAVSHFSNTNFSAFESSLATLHPFRGILVLSKDPNAFDGAVDDVATPSGPTTMTWRNQTRPVNMTLCELASLVTTEFFVFTDTFHAIASPVSVLMKGSKPVLPFLRAESRFCVEDQRCTASLQQAKDLFNVTLPYHYETFDTLFRTADVQSFCGDWERAEEALLARESETCLPLTGPSADDYMAWLSQRGPISREYAQEDRELKGWRVWTFLHTAHPADPRPCGVYTDVEQAWSSANISACSSYVEQPQGCQEDDQCMWRPIFRSGKCVPHVEEVMADWTVTTSATTTSATGTKTTATGTSTATSGTETTTRTTPTTTATTTRTETQTATSLTRTQTSTVTTTMTATATTTTTVALSRFATSILALNTTGTIKDLLVKVKSGAEKALQGSKSAAARKVVVKVAIESLQEARFFLNIVVSSTVSGELTARADSILKAAKRAYCNRLSADQCDLTRQGSKTGLRWRKGTHAHQRRLAQSSGLDLPFEAFTILSDQSQVADMRELESAAFLPALESELSTELPDTSFQQFSEVTFTPPVESAQAVISYEIPEENRAEVTALQQELAQPEVITSALADANGDTSILLGTPVVDNCLGRDCGGHGTCAAGICSCEAEWTGVNCLLPAEQPRDEFYVTVYRGKSGGKVPLIISLSLLGSFLVWLVPVAVIYWRRLRRPAGANASASEDPEANLQSNRAPAVNAMLQHPSENANFI